MDRKKILFSIIAAIVLLGLVVTTVSLAWQKAESFTVTFQDFDGTVLKTQKVKAGRSASAPKAPQREGYAFVSWDKSFTNITKDTLVTAEYLRITDTAFVVDTVTVQPGTESVEVKVSVQNNPGILGMVLSVSYDEQALKLTGCQNGVALSALTFQEPSSFASGCNFVWYGSETGEVLDGEMLILSFALNPAAQPGSYPVSVSWSERDIYDNHCDMVDPEVTQGAVVVE